MADLDYDNIGDSPVIKLNNIKCDPDAKIQMSLDEIIHVYGPSVSLRRNGKNLLKKKPLHGVMQRRPIFKRSSGVKLPSTLGGGHFIVSKHSPLIKRNLSQRREIETRARAEMNRALNAPLLRRNQEIIPATYKLIKTHLGFERVLVPTISNPPPLVQVGLPRKPFQNLNKRLPPKLIDTSEKTQQRQLVRSKTPNSLPPPLLDTAFKSEPAKMVESVPARHFNIPALIDTASNPQVNRKRSIASRLGPPSLIDTAQVYEPMEIEDSTAHLGPPPLVSLFQHSAKITPPTTMSSHSRVPPLVKGNFNRGHPPPLVDLVSDDEGDDVKPLLVNKKRTAGKNSSISLNERFSFIQN